MELFLWLQKSTFLVILDLWIIYLPFWRKLLLLFLASVLWSITVHWEYSQLFLQFDSSLPQLLFHVDPSTQITQIYDTVFSELLAKCVQTWPFASTLLWKHWIWIWILLTSLAFILLSGRGCLPSLVILQLGSLWRRVVDKQVSLCLRLSASQTTWRSPRLRPVILSRYVAFRCLVKHVFVIWAIQH